MVDVGAIGVKRQKISRSKWSATFVARMAFRGGIHGSWAVYYEHRRQYAGEARSPELPSAAHRGVSTALVRAGWGLVVPRCESGHMRRRAGGCGSGAGWVL